MRGDVHQKRAACVTCASVSKQGVCEKPALVSIPVGGLLYIKKLCVVQMRVLMCINQSVPYCASTRGLE